MKNAKMICEKCGNGVEITSKGMVNLICQVCGCCDMKFDTDVQLTPVFANSERGQKVMIKAEEPFFSVNKETGGSYWEVSVVEPVPKEVKEPKGEENEESPPPLGASVSESLNLKEDKGPLPIPKPKSRR